MNAVANQEEAVGVCATCGRSITHPGPNGECVRCLVGFGFLADDHESQPGGMADRVLLGPLRYAHFELETNADGFPAILGAGAMAVTYRARDTILNSTVALKVIGRKLAENPTARARFLKEARAAAQIQHPNVARVIHYGEQDGECFYAMQLVRGETLEARVQRGGPLPLAVALEVIEKTARGLAAGEACGVVHRDLKPSNVMIESDPSGQLIVKIIDYGVAKVMAADATVQTQAGFIGTPSFASPEQFDEAGQRQIDTRSDIYALGVTFWYLLTGRTPFAGRSIEEIRARQMEQLPLEQLKGAHTPAQVVVLLKSMLAVDPSKRPHTALALLTSVHRCCVRFEPTARRRRKQLVFAAAGLVLSIALVILATFLYQRAGSSSAWDRSIAVLPFENLSPNSDDAFFTVGMQDEIIANLASLSDITVIGAQSTRSYLPGKDRNLPMIGRELGVRHLLEGSVWRENNTMRVALRLVDVRDLDHPWTQNYERPTGDVFALQSEITRSVALRLQSRLAPNETAEIDVPPTTDLRAYDLYLRALAVPHLVKDSLELRQAAEKRVSLLEQAVVRDPKFALAYCMLARAHEDLNSTKNLVTGETQRIDHRALAQTALEKARLAEKDAGPVHLALANHFLWVDHDLEHARNEIDLARRTMPNSSDLEDLAGTIARTQGRWDEAIGCFEKALALEPRQNHSRFTLANIHRLMRHYDEWDRLIAEVIRSLPAQDSGSYRATRALVVMEAKADLAPLRVALNNMSREDDPDGRIRDLHNVLLALADHDADAVLRNVIPAADSTFVFNGLAHPKGWYEGLAARIRGDAAGAQAAFKTARVQVEKGVLADAKDARALGLLAMIDAGLGRKEDAVREARRACELAPFETQAVTAPIVRCDLAVVYGWTGQSDSAIAELEKLLSKPAGGDLPAQPTYGDFRLNPVWDPLRKDQRFEALVQRLAPKPSR